MIFLTSLCKNVLCKYLKCKSQWITDEEENCKKKKFEFDYGEKFVS